MKPLIFTAMLVAGLSANAQQSGGTMQTGGEGIPVEIAAKTVFKIPAPNQTYTAILDVSGCDQTQIDGLKETLQGWEEKVTAVQYAPSTGRLLVTYNEFMDLTDLVEACGRFKVSCSADLSESGTTKEF